MPVCHLCSGRSFVDDDALRMHKEAKHPLPHCASCDRSFNSQQSLEQHNEAKHPLTYDCDVCDHKFSSPKSLEQHTEAKHPPTYDCNICDREFSTPKALEQHQEAKHPPTYDCDICDREFQSPESLEQHMSAKHPPWECDDCDRKFCSSEALEQHTAAKHPPTYSCDDCDEVFSSADALQRHTSSKHPTWECDHCDREFSSAQALEQHTAAKHPPTYDCDEVFSSEDALQSHTSSKHPPTYDCDDCDEVFSSTDALQRHTSANHSTWECDHCDREFSSAKALEQHTAAKHPTYDCDICDEEFSSPGALECHTSAKHSTWECEDCDRTFRSPGALEQHATASHPTIYPFNCGECSRTFHSPQAYDHHAAYAHHICDICGKDFPSDDALQAHVDCHTARCESCGLGFVSDSALEEHNMTAHAPTYPCLHCSKAFNTPWSRLLHTNVQHIKYNCDTCSIQFDAPAALLRHKALSHPTPLVRCERCGFVCRSDADLQAHADAEHVSSSWEEEEDTAESLLCNQCSELFGSATALLEHTALVHPAPPCYCTICERAGISPCACNICKRSSVSPEVRGLRTLSEDGHLVPPESTDEMSSVHSGESEDAPEAGEQSEPELTPVAHTQPSRTSLEAYVAASWRAKDLHYRCIQCEENFATDEALQDHYFTAPEDVHPTCPKCERGFVCDVALCVHAEIAHPKLPCGSCGGETFYPEELEKHYLVSWNHFQCFQCDIGLRDRDSFNEHLRTIHSSPEAQRHTLDQWIDTETWTWQGDRFQCYPSRGDADGTTLVDDSVASHKSASPDTNQPINDTLVVGVSDGRALDDATQLPSSVSESKTIPDSDMELESETSSTQDWSEEGNDGRSRLGAEEVAPLPEDDHTEGTSSEASSEGPIRTPVSHSVPVREESEGSWNLAYRLSLPSPTPSEQGSTDGPVPLAPDAQGPDNVDRVQSPLSSQESDDEYFYVSPPTSPLSSSDSEVLVSAEAIPRYVRDNRAYLVATSARTRSPSRSATSSPILLSSVCSSIASLRAPEREAEVTTQPSSPAPTLRFHCRICHKDPCDDLTVTTCGHLFCYRCITTEVMAKSACPVCQKPTLLYCLFHVDATV
ncbi:hypothetical protein BV22DRAFT_1030378 [Leucogyrophana mollusca]|uniref:Uncharacterized protein n=1 Tax=Leucogyrophana mollusca TaxID=85980 RepID=A0ACB8BUR8_9AGAM|nr:hypothetical protein BV22DRAFT_1030378 [Leucogyrophana mollusca]